MRQTQQQKLASELRTVISRLIKKLRSQSSVTGKLSLTERSVIKLLDEHGALLPSELAAMEKVTTQSMSQILNHLFELGYITRNPSEEDKRKVIIRLSTEGQQLLYTTRHERDEWLTKAIAATFTKEEQEMLRTIMPSLSKLVDID